MHQRPPRRVRSIGKACRTIYRVRRKSSRTCRPPGKHRRAGASSARSQHAPILYAHLHVAMAASVCPPPSAALADVGVVSGGLLARVLEALCALALRPTWRRRWLVAGSALVALLALAAFALQLGALDASGLVAARDARRDIVAALAAVAAFEGLHAFAMADGGVLRGPCLGRTVAPVPMPLRCSCCAAPPWPRWCWRRWPRWWCRGCRSGWINPAAGTAFAADRLNGIRR